MRTKCFRRLKNGYGQDDSWNCKLNWHLYQSGRRGRDALATAGRMPAPHRSAALPL